MTGSTPNRNGRTADGIVWTASSVDVFKVARVAAG
jgi:hypothetical protein